MCKAPGVSVAPGPHDALDKQPPPASSSSLASVSSAGPSSALNSPPAPGSSPISVTPAVAAAAPDHNAPPLEHSSAATPLRLSFALEQRRIQAAIAATRADAIAAVERVLERVRCEAALLDNQVEESAVVAFEELCRREELDAREADIQRREQELHAAQQAVARQMRRSAAADLVERRRVSTAYSAVDHAALAKRESQVAAREAHLNDQADQIRRSKEALIAGERQVAAQEAQLAARVRTVDQREEALREMSISLDRQRDALQTELHTEREAFWKHQEKLTALVAAQVDGLVAEHRAARASLDQELDVARHALKRLVDERNALERDRRPD